MLRRTQLKTSIEVRMTQCLSYILCLSSESRQRVQSAVLVLSQRQLRSTPKLHSLGLALFFGSEFRNAVDQIHLKYTKELRVVRPTSYC